MFEHLLDSLAAALTQDCEEASPAVLSCGGIFFSKRKVPLEVRTWQQVVCTANKALSAKVYEVTPSDPNQELNQFLLKESFN